LLKYKYKAPIRKKILYVNKLKQRVMNFLKNLLGKKETHNFGTFIEPVEGQTYKTIVIGKQEWMAQNLNVSHYRDGTPIPKIEEDYDWDEIPQKTDIKDDEKCAWCYYDNNIKYGIVYGKLYNWHTVNNPRGLAPEGWHISTKEDWLLLKKYISGSESGKGVDSIKLLEKGKSHWSRSSRKVTNETGFTALPGGQRLYDGTFKNIRQFGYWWSSDLLKDNPSRALYSYISYHESNLELDYIIKDFGFSVRCVKD
jgi:uncharacterized protein (TIGR02145 family)